MVWNWKHQQHGFHLISVSDIANKHGQKYYLNQWSTRFTSKYIKATSFRFSQFDYLFCDRIVRQTKDKNQIFACVSSAIFIYKSSDAPRFYSNSVVSQRRIAATRRYVCWKDQVTYVAKFYFYAKFSPLCNYFSSLKSV